MKRFLASAVVLVLATTASAHFAYILPSADRSKVQVVFSDLLEPDTKVSIDKIAATTLYSVDANGKHLPLKWTKGEHALLADLPGKDVQVIGGVTDYGFIQSKHTQNKPVWLKYYPKAILGDATAAEKIRLGDKVPLEIVAIVRDGKIGFQALLKGKALAGAEFGILTPGAEKSEKTTTESDGTIKTRFDKPGRYGVRVSHFEPITGQLDGKKYEEIRHYATLVVELAKK